MSLKDTCVFCRVVTRQHKEEILYEDQDVLVFLDRFKQPSMGGHILVIPREHYENIWTMPETFCAPLMEMTQIVAQAVKAVYPDAGAKIWISNGRQAGQEIDHLHVHIYPSRSFLDWVKYVNPLFRRRFGDDQLAQMARPLRVKLNELVKTGR